MARRGMEDGMELIIILVCAGFLLLGNIERFLPRNPNYPFHDKVKDMIMPEWCSGIFILVIVVIVLNWFTKRD
jgi:disulfide bond formation protein DsbB